MPSARESYIIIQQLDEVKIDEGEREKHESTITPPAR